MLVISIGLVVARRFRVAGLVYVAAITVEVAAHLFQPGTVVEEVREVALHPIWAVRAETYRIFRTKRDGRPVVDSSR